MKSLGANTSYVLGTKKSDFVVTSQQKQLTTDHQYP